MTMWRGGKTPDSPRLPVYHVKPTRWQHIGCPCLMYSARKLDAEVWAGLVERLQDRGFIARQIAAHEREDTTSGELAAVDRRQRTRPAPAPRWWRNWRRSPSSARRSTRAAAGSSPSVRPGKSRADSWPIWSPGARRGAATSTPPTTR